MKTLKYLPAGAGPYLKNNSSENSLFPAKTLCFKFYE